MTIRDILLLLTEASPVTVEGWVTKFTKKNGEKWVSDRPWLSDTIKKVVVDVEDFVNLEDKYRGMFLNIVFSNWMQKSMKANDSQGCAHIRMLVSGFASNTKEQDSFNMYFENKNKPDWKEIVVPMNELMNTRFGTEIELSEYEKAGNTLEKFHEEAVIKMGDKVKGGKSKPPIFTSGAWEVHNPTSFKDNSACATINNPDDKSVNRKANWCTAASNNYFKNYPNIYVIKRKAKGKGDKGVLLQMNWGTKSKSEINFKNEDDTSIRFGSFQKMNVPSNVLKAIPAPAGHEFDGKTLADVTAKAIADIESTSSKDKTRSRGSVGKWLKKSYSYKNNGQKVIENKLEDNLSGFKFSVQLYSDKNVKDVEAVIKKGAGNPSEFSYNLYKSKDASVVYMEVLKSNGYHIVARSPESKFTSNVPSGYVTRMDLNKGVIGFDTKSKGLIYRKNKPWLNESVLYNFVDEILS